MCGILEKWKHSWRHIKVGGGCVEGEIV